jgi:peptide chain release factor 3
MKRFIDENAHRIAHDAVEAPTFLAAYDAELKAAHELWPNIRFHALREHAGLVFHSNSIT